MFHLLNISLTCSVSKLSCRRSKEPFYIKDMVVTKNTRRVNTYRKMWVSVYVCLNTKAVKFYLIPGYSAEDFLFGWEQHVSDCGKPSTVYSDMGTNIASAAKDITEEIDFQLIARSTGGYMVLCSSCSSV